MQDTPTIPPVDSNVSWVVVSDWVNVPSREWTTATSLHSSYVDSLTLRALIKAASGKKVNRNAELQDTTRVWLEGPQKLRQFVLLWNDNDMMVMMLVSGLNEELVHLLIERDDLHMEQDSMLVDIEDLTRWGSVSNQSFSFSSLTDHALGFVCVSGSCCLNSGMTCAEYFDKSKKLFLCSVSSCGLKIMMFVITIVSVHNDVHLY